MANETAGGCIAEFVQAQASNRIQPLPFIEARIMAAELLKLDGRCMSLIERLATLEAERDDLRAFVQRRAGGCPFVMHEPKVGCMACEAKRLLAATQEGSGTDGG